MRVTKAQAQANRAHIVETASVQFREHGYDGVGVADLMAAAGFTHGGFYKHFGSKSDLMAEAAACSMSKIVEQSAGVNPAHFIEYYLSREHRDDVATGCTMAALGGDASRQSDDVKNAFANGIEQLLKNMASDSSTQEADPKASRAALLDMVAHAVGAVMLSRAVPNDSKLADEILEACRATMLVQAEKLSEGVSSVS
ncbi:MULTISPECIES: TetR/AcrR family transcriptional regulator [Pseudomonas syringae group]|uniref:TetR family transcriptional regulator n=1 Tax=Pseudomonas syringae pv. primulae TaxID=251707 RepID=A0A0Q0DKJ7_9PSED|nr:MULTISPECIES: TetR family transcriptional regulator [Pseudomonas syringae group]KPY40093.1 TetR family transcriptional regulator [Pseudomonas syringae pv. primulae]MBD8189008.1 TetR family transcriptional regulator [Pseudomonas viridiflava]MBD8201133.1 TetR family transcriptional regulator [Pseudomonas viridiflava]MDY0934735.1 TetR family transcriptional regulator [Pseudomonas viridiflava]MDY1014372.1 TetR family transcriptional regulator [Pseudomonas viridiflava]